MTFGSRNRVEQWSQLSHDSNSGGCETPLRLSLIPSSPSESGVASSHFTDGETEVQADQSFAHGHTLVKGELAFEPSYLDSQSLCLHPRPQSLSEGRVMQAEGTVSEKARGGNLETRNQDTEAGAEWSSGGSERDETVMGSTER